MFAFLLSTSIHAETFNPLDASFDQLLFHAQRYGNTEEKRENKRIAREEIFARGPDSLEYLLSNIHIENLWIRILAQESVERLPAEDAVPILLSHLESEHEITKKMATYFLGFYETPEHADVIMPLLDHEKLAGAAIRTLGKWKVESAVRVITPFLEDGDERKRIVAVNALGEIRAENSIEQLMASLSDPVFTVRNCARHALTNYGKKAEKPIIQAVRDSEGRYQRQLIRTLGDMQSRKAIRTLRKLLDNEDEQVRLDVEEALRAIDPEKADRWIERGGSFFSFFGLFSI